MFKPFSQKNTVSLKELKEPNLSYNDEIVMEFRREKEQYKRI